MLKKKPLGIKGVYIIENFASNDIRGKFIKPFSELSSKLIKPDFIIKEIYYSISKKNVIRGMHFQIPPYENDKLVFLTSGEITDVLLDLRKSSETFKTYVSIDLIANTNAIYIPKGVAHGFLAKKENATMVYCQNSNYKGKFDRGIAWDSFGIPWKVKSPIISARDRSFLPLDKFKSPFK